MAPTSEKTYVEARDLFDDVTEGDLITWDGREEPLTVYRHVTEDDAAGQIFTLRELDPEWFSCCPGGVDPEIPWVHGGDLLEASLTGDEFLAVRGPRGGAYILTQRWSKHGGRWSAVVDLFRRTREDNRPWTWENDVTVSVVGHEEVDRDEFDADGPWVRHTDVSGRAIWENMDEATLSEYHDAAMFRTREPEIPEPEESVADVLSEAEEGDMITVNGVSGTVTEARSEDDGVLADGVFFKVEDADGEGPFNVRTYSETGNAAFMTPEGSGEVETASVSPAGAEEN